jgi:beta-lactamase regulating signal transducer with metallopeptidase domain
MAWWIFQNLVTTTVLAAGVALVCRYGRIGPVARHALWVLVLVKFITPPLVVWPWAAPDPFGIAASDTRSVQAVAAPVEMKPAAIEEPSNTALLPVAADASPQLYARTVSSSPMPWLISLWTLGSMCVIAIEGWRIARFKRRRRPMPEGHPIATRVHALASQLDVRPIGVDLVTGISSPVIWGWGRPRLLWPSALETVPSDASLDGIIVHELAHVKRGDHFVGWIELAAGVAWWWNPLFWSVRSARREQAELACDAWVISALPNGRRAYAESLLLLSGAVAPDASPMTAVGIRPGSRRVLERRLVMIMKGRSSLRLPWAGLCSLAIVGAASLPAWASASQQPPPPPPPAPVVVTQKAPPSPPTPRIQNEVVRKASPPPPPPRAVVGKTFTLHGTRQPVPPVVIQSRKGEYTYTLHRKGLPEDGEKLLESFDTDSKAIQEEANRKMEERRASAVKALEALQEQYTKAGKLDEAVAIRDFLRSGGPGYPYQTVRYAIKK